MSDTPRTLNRDSTARWPLWVWFSQVVVPLGMIAYFQTVLRYMPPWGTYLIPAIAVCAVWIAAVLLVLLVPAARRGLRANRWQIVALFVSILLAVAVADLMLTVTGKVETLAEMRRISLEHKPAVSSRSRLVPHQVAGRDVKFEINSRGFRGPEIDVPKPGGTTRIAFLGGSQVFDVNWDNWPLHVGKLLSTPDRPVEVINAAVPGHATTDSLGKLVTDVWMLEPDVIVVCQGWNDIKYFPFVTRERPYVDVVRPPPHDYRNYPTGLDRLLCVSAFYRKARHGLIYAITRGEDGALSGPPRKIQEWGPRQYQLSVQAICDVGQNLGARVVLCKQPTLPTPDSTEEDQRKMAYPRGLDHEELVKAITACHRAIEEVGAEKGCTVIDLTESISGRFEYFTDQIHFTPAGSRRAAEVVADGLRKIIASRAPVPPSADPAVEAAATRD